MATTVVKTIGTGGDYSTLQAWEDACPADLVAVDQIWQGRLKNQEFSSSSTPLVISGTTTDATRYIELTTEAGASFRDNANKATNPLRYDSSVGAGIKITASWARCIDCSVNYTRFTGLQLMVSAANSAAIFQIGSGVTITITNCVIESVATQFAVDCGGQAVIANAAIISRASSGGGVQLVMGGSIYNSSIVNLVGGSGTGVRGSYGTNIIKNCYVGGFTNTTGGGSSKTIVNSFTSQSTPPSGWSGPVALSTATFESVTSGSHDLRLKSGSGLIDVGADESTYSATDIIGTARTSGSYDVGAWEFSAGGGGSATTTIGATLGNITGSVASVSSPKTAIAATLANVAGSLASGSGSLVTTITAALANITGSITSTGNTANGTFTSEVLKDYAGNVLANTALNFVRFYNDTTGALVLNKTGVSTNGSGIVTFSDAALVAGTTYRVDWETAAGSRRMPRKAAA